MHKALRLMPDPAMYADWRQWAAAVRDLLDGEFGTHDLQLPVHPKATLPSAKGQGMLAYVPDESGGAVPAFSDGANWRRVTDRNVVS